MMDKYDIAIFKYNIAAGHHIYTGAQLIGELLADWRDYADDEYDFPSCCDDWPLTRIEPHQFYIVSNTLDDLVQYRDLDGRPFADILAEYKHSNA